MPEHRPLPLWAALIASVAGGVAFWASFPAPNIWPLVFVAIVLALVSLIGRRMGGAFLVGLVFGLSFYLPHVSWASQFLGDNPYGWVPWVALAVVEATLLGVLGILIALAYRWAARAGWTGVARTAVLPLIVAGLWTTREVILGSFPYGGFAWGRVGMSQAESPLAQVASWVGVSGLTFLIVLACALAVEAARVWRSAARFARWRSAAIPVVLLAAIAAIPQFPTTVTGDTLRVGAVQGNGLAAYMDEREPYAVLNSQLAASEDLPDDLDLVVWPEGGVDSDPLYNEATAAALDAFVERMGAPLLMNAASGRGEDPTRESTLIYNTSMLWMGDGDRDLQLHSKRHPVPFGEYVPDRAFFEAIAPDLIGLIGREYTAGTDAPTVRVDDVTIGLAICFDVISDSLIREGIDGGAQVLILQTNNADFRGTDENLQQLAFARMRAIETGRTVVNLSTTGTSQIISADGATLDELPIDEAGSMVADLELRTGTTAGVLLGPWIVGFLVAGSLLGLAAAGVLARRRARHGDDVR